MPDAVCISLASHVSILSRGNSICSALFILLNILTEISVVVPAESPNK
jgi:hypothetical protein